MKISESVTQEEFDALLEWLAPNREASGVEYEKIRRGLIRFFQIKGCQDPQELTDETINRVARKIKTDKLENTGANLYIFLGFAKKVFLEYLRKSKQKEVQLSDSAVQKSAVGFFHKGNEDQFECLEKCLTKLQTGDREMIIRYYGQKGVEKIEFHRKLAENIGISVGNLHTRIYRMRNSLRDCVSKCLTKKNFL